MVRALEQIKTSNIMNQSKRRFMSNHEEFGRFLKAEIKRLGIVREAFRSACCLMQNDLEDIKKGVIILR